MKMCWASSTMSSFSPAVRRISASAMRDLKSVLRSSPSESPRKEKNERPGSGLAFGSGGGSRGLKVFAAGCVRVGAVFVSEVEEGDGRELGRDVERGGTAESSML